MTNGRRNQLRYHWKDSYWPDFEGRGKESYDEIVNYFGEDNQIRMFGEYDEQECAYVCTLALQEGGY